MRLTGKTAIVTGGGSGFGEGIAKTYAREGANVVVNDLNGAAAERVASEIAIAGGKAIAVAGNVALREDWQKLREAALEDFGSVQIVVNNAGTTHRNKPVLDVTEAEFDRVYAVNVKAPFFLVAELAPAMAKRGHGAIINIGTMVAQFGAAEMALYGSSKAALVLLTKSWAAEYGPAGVRVNAVSPGPTRTEGTAAMGEALDQLAAAAPGGRPGLPEEIAAAITYLASDAASFVHGAVLPVDGGRIAV